MYKINVQHCMQGSTFPLFLNVKIIYLWLPLKPRLPSNTQLRSMLSDRLQGLPIIRWSYWSNKCQLHANEFVLLKVYLRREKWLPLWPWKAVHICMKLKKGPPTPPRNSPSPPSSESCTSLLISLTTHEGRPLHKSHYSVTSAAAHRPIREAGKTQGYMAESKVKRFNSSLSSSALISREIYQLVKRRNQGLYV